MRFLFTFLLFSICDASNGQIPSYVPTNGLVGWWPFNGNANDESGNGHNGNVVTNSSGSISFVSDRFGSPNSSIQFSGNPTWNSINTYIQLTNTSNINFSGSYTLNFFLNVDPTCEVGQVLSKGADRLSAFGVRYHSYSTFSIGSPAGGFGIDAAQMIGNWKMITMTRNETDNQGCLYVNGILFLSSNVGVTNSNNADIWFGAHNEMGIGNGSMYPYIGKLDDLSIYNRVLSSNEIYQIYSGVVIPTTPEDTTSNVGIGTITPKRKLHVNDVMRLEPRDTVPANPAKGDIYFDGVLNKLRVFDGSLWQNCW